MKVIYEIPHVDIKSDYEEENYRGALYFISEKIPPLELFPFFSIRLPGPIDHCFFTSYTNTLYPGDSGEDKRVPKSDPYYIRFIEETGNMVIKLSVGDGHKDSDPELRKKDFDLMIEAGWIKEEDMEETCF